MRIVIEAQRIFRRDKHGMDFVALETIRALQQLDKVNEYYIIVKPGEDRCLQESANFHLIELSCPTYLLWEQVALPFCLSRIKPDLVHCTSNTAPLFCRHPLLLTLHDIIYLERKSGENHSLYQNMGRIYRRWIVPRIIPKCRLIITVSNYERTHIQDRLNLKDDQIVTLYNGLNPIFHPSRKNRSIVDKYMPEKEYLFFLGNTDPKKNTVGTLKGYSFYLKKSNKKLPLLIADLEESIVDQLLDRGGIPEIKSHLYLPGYITNNELPYIYSDAFVFLYTSLRESFGLPLLEAMASGVPVVSSLLSAIPEIAGAGALLVDPTNPEAIANRLIELEEDTLRYKEAVDYGLKRASSFSWHKTASQLLDIYHQLKTE